MRVIYSTPDNPIAKVYVGQLDDGSKIEFVRSVQPPIDKEEKLVLIISTLKGCPVDCPMCDAGGNYKGRLSTEEMLWQIQYMIKDVYNDDIPRTKRLKIQFARMGDPSFNDNVLKILKLLPDLYDHKTLMPSISTIAPSGTELFFDELSKIKNELYPNGMFQMQFSIHTTDELLRKKLIPTKIWDFVKISEYGDRFFTEGDRKITLNFATPLGYPLEPAKLLDLFSPDKYAIKLTPVNPTKKSIRSGLSSLIDTNAVHAIIKGLEDIGYNTILSIGESEENLIGSNCGMYIERHKETLKGSITVQKRD